MSAETLLAIALPLAQGDQAAAEGVCVPATAEAGLGANPLCIAVYRLTGIDWLATALGTAIPAGLRIVVVLVVAFLAHRFIRRFIRHFMRSWAERALERVGTLERRGRPTTTREIGLQRVTQRTQSVGAVLRSTTSIVIWSLTALLVLGEVGISLGPLIAGAGIVGIALGFGAQNLVRDFLSGLFMLLEDQFGVGDIIDAGEAVGVVEGISLRTVRLRDVHGTLWHVPNGEINRIGNFSQHWARALLDIGVAYDTDIPTATELIKRVADDLWRDPEWGALIQLEPEVWGVQDFGPNEILIRLVVQTDPLEQWAVARELRKRLKAAFDEAGIEIPFPQRTVWMHSPDGAEPAEEEARRQRFNMTETTE